MAKTRKRWWLIERRHLEEQLLSPVRRRRASSGQAALVEAQPISQTRSSTTACAAHLFLLL